MKSAQLQDRLAAKHLEDTETLKEAVQEAIKPVDKPQEAEPDPRDQKSWTFDFRWIDGKKKTWEGSFTNQILTLGEQQQVAILEAKLSGGMPYDSIDANARTINHAIAHMVYSLREAPEWAKDLRKLEDPGLIIALYQEVASHEARFFGLI